MKSQKLTSQISIFLDNRMIITAYGKFSPDYNDINNNFPFLIKITFDINNKNKGNYQLLNHVDMLRFE